MDRCLACKGQTHFYGLQVRPVKARWIICYDCRGGNGRNAYSFMTETGHAGVTYAEPNRGYFKNSKEISDEVRDEN